MYMTSMYIMCNIMYIIHNMTLHNGHNVHKCHIHVHNIAHNGQKHNVHKYQKLLLIVGCYLKKRCLGPDEVPS